MAIYYKGDLDKAATVTKTAVREEFPWANPPEAPRPARPAGFGFRARPRIGDA